MRNKLKVWVISDTHGMHRLINIPDDIDLLIHAGDSTNYYDPHRNEIEFRDFLDWYEKLPVKYKVLIAGNHDASLMKRYCKEMLEEAGIIYLEHEYANIEGIKIFGSPYTPTFNNWYFMKDRSKLDQHWSVLDENIDILVTHGPPKGILDLAENPDRDLQFCGDKSLLRHVLRVKPKYHIFGHIHDNKECINQGIRVYENITFMNVSCVTDEKFDFGPTSHGLTFEI